MQQMADAADERAYIVGETSRSTYIVVYLNKADMVDDPELLELVEVEIRDLLKHMDTLVMKSR